MAVAGDGVSAPSRFDPNLRPKHSGRNVDRGNLRHGDGLIVTAKPPRLHSADAQWAHQNTGWEKKIALGPAAGGENLGRRICRWCMGRYTHSSAPFFPTQM